MNFKIFTIPFDSSKQLFNEEDVNKFCINKKINEHKVKFFNENGKNYWSVYIGYENILEKSEVIQAFSESEKILFDKLREWRKEAAEKDGVPVYIAATNSQLENIVKSKPTTLEQLKNIDGFGAKKVEKYGKEIIEKIKLFCEAINE